MGMMPKSMCSATLGVEVGTCRARRVKVLSSVDNSDLFSIQVSAPESKLGIRHVFISLSVVSMLILLST